MATTGHQIEAIRSTLNGSIVIANTKIMAAFTFLLVQSGINTHVQIELLQVFNFKISDIWECPTHPPGSFTKVPFIWSWVPVTTLPPKTPWPRKLSLISLQNQPTVYIRIANLSQGVRQLVHRDNLWHGECHTMPKLKQKFKKMDSKNPL